MHWLPVIWHVIILQSIIQRQPTTVTDNTFSDALKAKEDYQQQLLILVYQRISNLRINQKSKCLSKPIGHDAKVYNLA